MNIVKALEQTASVYAHKTAYTFSGAPVTYGKLNQDINRFAAGLHSIGLQKNDHIALLLGNGAHFINSFYGALKAGLTVVPINPMYKADEISYILQNSDVKAVVMSNLSLPVVEKVHEKLPGVKHYILCESNKDQMAAYTCSTLSVWKKMKTFTELTEHFSSCRFPAVNQDDTAVILYTSGTTGKPKGAMLTHQNIYSNARDTAHYLSMTEKDTVITVLPMFHVFCLTVMLNAPILCGAEMLILSSFSPKQVFKEIKEKKATVFAGVPTMYNFLFQYLDGKPEDLASLRLCISGGAPMPVSLLESFEKKFRVQISEGYGLSEASPVTAFNPLDRPRKAGSIGCSIPNVENKIVNELGEELEPGQVGELIVKGPNIMKGYYKMPEETAATVRDQWLYTGDLAYRDKESYFYIVDRKKDLIIVGGYNVYPREVEEVLYAHCEIVEAAVLGMPDRDYGEAVIAYIVQKGNNLTEKDVINYCGERLVSYKVPAFVEFLQELPKNTTGKILRRALKKQITGKH